MKHVEVALDDFEAALAEKIGDGDCALGIRRALVLTGLRSEENAAMGDVLMQKTPDRLTIVTNQMAELAEELKQAESNPKRREEIAVQLVRLGKLYLSVSTGSDLAEKDR